jgi:D-3-phosphoglycerate dehydrogenase
VRVAILDDYQSAVATLDCFAGLAEHDVDVLSESIRDATALAERLRDVEALVLIRERTAITADLLERLPSLRLIAQTGRGIPHIDVDACTARGVLVCVGGGSPVAPAELTWALVLAAVRHLPTEVENVRKGGWQSTLGTELAGKTLGILGYGTIGALVARYGRAFDMDVLAYGRAGSVARAEADGVRVAASRDELLATSDVLSLHVKLAAETRGLVTAADLGLMKPTSLLVNTARAGLIETGALAAGVAAGRPGMAAVDVFDEEPVSPGAEPLLGLENVIATPHIGYVTRESYELYFGQAIAQVNAFASGEAVEAVNPEALSRT